MVDNQINRKKLLLKIIKLPLLFVLILWVIKTIEIYSNISFIEYGVLPREISGIKGVFFSPLIHKDFKHLINNSVPLLILGSALCYFLKQIIRKFFL